MKTYSLLLLMFMILLTACAPQSVGTSSPAPVSTNTSVITNTPLATATLEPTQILEPTPTSIPTADISLDSCNVIMEARISSAGVLEVVYGSGDAFTTGASKFLLTEDTLHAALWLWSEDTQASVRLPLPQNAVGPKLSADHHWIVYRRDPGLRQSELWVVDTQGQNEKRLATLSSDEIEVRYPGLAGSLELSLNYGWVPNTDKILYSIVPGGGADIFIYDTVALVDVNSGQAISLAQPGEEASKVVIAPDGSQAAVLTATEMRLISTTDGTVEFTLPMSLGSYGVGGSPSPAYSPDGKYIIDFTEEGIVRMNTEDGLWQVLPLKYTVISPAGGDSAVSRAPAFSWSGGSTLLVLILDSDQESVVQQPGSDPNWTFTLWQVDLVDGSSHPIPALSGLQLPVIFSPDGDRLAFYRSRGAGPSQTMDGFVADIAAGEILETIEDGVFEAWSSDFNEYIYSTNHPKQRGEVDNTRYYLGTIGAEPILLNWGPLGTGWSGWFWVDRHRFVWNCKVMRLP